MAELLERAEALQQVCDIAAPHLRPESLGVVEQTLARVRARLETGGDSTVIGLLGPTGVGKSTLFNALVGSDVSTASPVRPTTQDPVVYAFGDPPDQLLQRIGLRATHVSDPPYGWDGVVLVDLPDVDSIESTHRQKVDRLIEHLDLMLWVVDPEKYADGSVLQEYLVPLRAYGSSTVLVINKADLVDADLRLRMADHVQRLLEGAGHHRTYPQMVSACSGEGIRELRDLLADVVRARRSVVEVLTNDVREAARTVSPDMAPVRLDDARRERVATTVERAMDLDVLARELRRARSRSIIRATSWPPLRRLAGGAPPPEPPPAPPVGSALEDLAQGLGGGVDPPWGPAIRTSVLGRGDALAQSLRRRVAAALEGPQGLPAWATAVGWVQQGLAGLAAIAFVAAVLLALVQGAEGVAGGSVPSPSGAWRLLAASVVLGLGFDLAGRVGAAAEGEAAEEAARAAARLAVAESVDDAVLAPLDDVLTARERVNRLCGVAAMGPSGR